MNKDKMLTPLAWAILSILFGSIWALTWISTGSLLWGWLYLPVMVVLASILVWAFCRVMDSLP